MVLPGDLPWQSIPDRRFREYDKLTEAVIGSAVNVHRALGPGLPESVYQRALAVRLAADGLRFERERRVAVDYEGISVGEFQIDFLVEDAVVVELKALEQILPVHLRQVITYVSVLGRELGLLLNFGSSILQPRRVIPPKAVQSSQPYQLRVRSWKQAWATESRWRTE